MIETNRWYAIIPANKVKKGRLLAIKRFGKDLILYRDKAGAIQAMLSKCPHRGANLAQGELTPDANVKCPFHGIEYSASGEAVTIPANGHIDHSIVHIRADVYQAEEQHDFIWLWYGDKQLSYPPVPWFDNLDKKMAYRETFMLWPCHYSRCIENQLDTIHLPFVHKKTIGRSGKTVVNGPYIVEHEKGFFIYADNRRDEGQKALTASQMEKPLPSSTHLEFLWPNVWQNYLFKKGRILIIFAPVDEHHTAFYMRYYHHFPTLIGSLVRLWGLRYSMKIAGEDKRVVQEQQPDQSSLHMNEHLLRQDSPIILYRKKRAAEVFY